MKKTCPITAVERSYTVEKEKSGPVSEYYGEDTFNIRVMKGKLPGDAYDKIIDAIHENTILDIETANTVAHAMAKWAIEKGATHFAHWFQPMTGITAEKHDAFIDVTGPSSVIERFFRQAVVQGEPDASSFPSGGIRATFEARGYTAWDMSSPAFIRRNGISTTLCIPTAFISYTGQALDKKTPLLRSNRAVSKSALNILSLLGGKSVRGIFATLGPEQEYFLIDSDFFFKRPDLVMGGRAVVGALPPKDRRWRTSISAASRSASPRTCTTWRRSSSSWAFPPRPGTTRWHPASLNSRRSSRRPTWPSTTTRSSWTRCNWWRKSTGWPACSMKKPFAGINGSGKHVNWSLSDNKGNNLLNPGQTPQDNIQFLVFLLAVIRAVYRHADILRASVGSYANDHRLGANEAPPAIISIFLGDQLTKILEDIEAGKVTKASDKEIINLGISSLPIVSKDNTDRNRTSPFAFTGNKFEFRAVGSAQSISFPATVLNTIVAESLDYMADKIKAESASRTPISTSASCR
jgi:glutamine synthetase